jgi:hypothetical protein
MHFFLINWVMLDHVNLNRVRSLTLRSSRGYDLRLDPPVNRRIPIARNRLQTVRKILAV